MSITTLIDVANLATRVFFTPYIGATSDKPDYDTMAYIIVDSIYRTMLKTKCSEVILAMDSIDVWRKDVFPRYKESRKIHRDKNANIDWGKFYSEVNSLFDNIKRYLPFKVLKVDRAEADDIIGVFTLHYTNKGIVIISTDEDFKQLVSRRVRLYQPIKKKWIDCDDPEKFLKLKCLMGQPKDDIFNALTPGDWPVGKRKPSMGEKMANKAIENLDEWLVSEGSVERYDRNKTLIDFRCIPEYIKKEIIHQYENYKFPSLEDTYTFFKIYDYKQYLENYHRVENNFIRLYQ